MKADWKIKVLMASLVLMLSFSLMPRISFSRVLESSETPSDDGRVLIGYAGCPGLSYALLFYNYEYNCFYICWELEDNGIVASCINKGGEASYYIWLRITDGNGEVEGNGNVVDEGWDGWGCYSTYGSAHAVTSKKAAEDIVWPLKWELYCLAGGTHKSNFWDRFRDNLDKIGPWITIISLVALAAIAVSAIYMTGGLASPFLVPIVAWAVVTAAQELLIGYLSDVILQEAIIQYMEDRGWEPGGESWATMLLGVVNENVLMESEATIDLSGPTYVYDTSDPYEDSYGPYELRQYTLACRAKNFNKIYLTFEIDPDSDSEIASFFSTGSDSSNWGHFEKNETHLVYWWDVGVECGTFPSRCLQYFWHDEYGNPYFDFGFLIDVDPECPELPGTDEQVHAAEVETYGIEYYAPMGSSNINNTQISVTVEYEYPSLPYTVNIELNITEPGEYILIIPFQQNKSMVIPIIVYPDDLPPLFWVGIPDVPDRDEEVMVVVPKRGDTPIILTRGTYPQSHIIYMHTPHVFFFEENTRIYIDLILLGESHRILIEKPGETDYLSIEFPEPEKYVAIIPEMPLGQYTLLWALRPDDAVVITTEILGPVQDLAISMPYPAKTTYVWMPAGNKVQIKLLSQRTPTTLTHLNQSGLYVDVLLNQIYLEMYYFQTGLTPFAWATLSKPEEESSSALLVDTCVEWPYFLNTSSNSTDPSVSLTDMNNPTPPIYKVELTAYMNLFSHPYIPSISTKTDEERILTSQIFSSGTVEYYDYNVYLNDGVTLTVRNDATLIFNNTNIICNFTADGAITIIVENDASLMFVNESRIHKIVGDGVTSYRFGIAVYNLASLWFKNSSVFTTSHDNNDFVRLYDYSSAYVYASMIYWNGEGFIDVQGSAELCVTWSYIFKVRCESSANLNAYLGSRILYTSLFGQSLVHAIKGPDMWYIDLAENSNFTVYDTTYTRNVSIGDSAHLILTENSTLYGTHVSGTKPLNWAINDPTTQVVWGHDSGIIRQHRLWTTYQDGTICPSVDVIFYDESLNEVFRVATSVIGYSGVILIYSEANSSETLIVAPGSNFNVNSEGPVQITVSPHDIAVTNVTQSKTVIGQGYCVSINVTVENQGDDTETFNIIIYANTTIINQTQLTLTSKNSTTVTSTWNTSVFAMGNYTMRGYAEPVLAEIDVFDNDFTDGFVYVGIPGDVDGNGLVEVKDLLAIALAYGSSVGEPRYQANLDVNIDEFIDVKDILIAALNYGKTGP